MVKVFSINCIFGNQRQPFEIYIGKPEATHHPIHWQKEWLATSKNGTIPEDFLNSLQRLFESAQKNNANFEDLCEYALISASKNINQGNEGIAKINSTVKSSDIDKYAAEFNQSGKKLPQVENNSEHKNQSENQASVAIASDNNSASTNINSNNFSKAAQSQKETVPAQKINQLTASETAQAQENSDDFETSSKLINSSGTRSEQEIETQTASSASANSAEMPLVKSLASNIDTPTVAQQIQIATQSVTSNVYGDDEDIL